MNKNNTLNRSKRLSYTSNQFNCSNNIGIHRNQRKGEATVINIKLLLLDPISHCLVIHVKVSRYGLLFFHLVYYLFQLTLCELFSLALFFAESRNLTVISFLAAITDFSRCNFIYSVAPKVLPPFGNTLVQVVGGSCGISIFTESSEF